MFSTRLLTAVSYGLALMIPAYASAATIYTDRLSFLAATSGASVTTFNRVTTDIAVGTGNTVQGYTFTGPTSAQSLIDASPFAHNPAGGVDGTSYFSLAGLRNNATFTIGLPGLVSAFGFDTHNYDVQNERTEIFILGQSLGLTPALRGQSGFLGFVADPGATFSTVSIVGRGFDVFNGFDNFTVAQSSAVPEPATWAMMLFGFGGLGYAMRRRPKVSARIRFA